MWVEDCVFHSSRKMNYLKIILFCKLPANYLQLASSKKGILLIFTTCLISLSLRDQSVAAKVFCIVIRRPFLFLFVIKCFRKCCSWNTKWEVLCVVKSCFRWVLALKSCPKCNFGQYWKAENETVCWCPCSSQLENYEKKYTQPKTCNMCKWHPGYHFSVHFQSLNHTMAWQLCSFLFWNRSSWLYPY